MKKLAQIVLVLASLTTFSQGTAYMPNRLVNNGGTVKAGDTITLVLKTTLKTIDSAQSFVSLRIGNTECGTIASTYKDVLSIGSFDTFARKQDSLLVTFIVPDFGNTQYCLQFGVSLIVVCKAGCTSGTYIEQIGGNKPAMKMFYDNTAVGVIDDIIAENGKLLYCLDLAGRVVEPRGFCIAVFENGKREKVIFE